MNEGIEKNGVYVVDEVADFIRCAPAKVRFLIKKGKIKPSNLSNGGSRNHYRITGEEILRFLNINNE